MAHAAPAQSTKGLEVHIDIEIEASAAEAWEVFGEGFGDWAEWSDGIASSTLAGPLAQGVIRTNDVPGFGVVTQELTRYEPTSRSLTYAMLSGMPPVLVAVENAWTIEPQGDGRCRLRGDAVFGLKWWAKPLSPVLRKKMTASLQGFADGFAQRMAG